jgi:hypothetical protein
MSFWNFLDSVGVNPTEEDLTGLLNSDVWEEFKNER